MALCDAAAAQKLAAQLSANRPVPTTGAEACARGMALLAKGQAQDAANVFSLMVDRKGANWETRIRHGTDRLGADRENDGRLRTRQEDLRAVLRVLEGRRPGYSTAARSS